MTLLCACLCICSVTLSALFLPFRLVQGLPSKTQRIRGKITLVISITLFLRNQPMKWVFSISYQVVLF